MKQCGGDGDGNDGNDNGNDDEETSTTTTTIFIPEDPDVSAQERVQQSIRCGGGTIVDGTHNCFSNGVTCQVEIQFTTNIISNNDINNNNNNTRTSYDTAIVLYCLDNHGRRKKRNKPQKPKQSSYNDDESLNDEEFYIRYEEYLEEKEIEETGICGEDESQGEGLVPEQVDTQHQFPQQTRRRPTKRRQLLLQAVATISKMHSPDRTDGDSRNDDDDSDDDEDRYDDLCYQLDFVETPMSPRRTRNIHLYNQDGDYDTTTVRSAVHPDRASGNDDIDNSNGHTKRHIVSMLTVYLEYSNGIGMMPPPNKAHWDDGGYTHTKYTYTFPTDRRVFTTGMDDCGRPFPIRPFIPPNTTTSTSAAINLRRYDRVFLFGDSTFCQFCRQRPNVKGKYYFQHNLRASEKVRVGLNTTTLSQLLESLHEQYGSLLCEQKTSKTALIVGSCLWDILDSQDTIQDRSFDDHVTACRDYINRIRQMYPNISVIWKSPMAVHIHWVDLERVIEHDKATATLFGRDRIRYMSRSRSKYLYDLQKRIMKEMDVPFLDLWQPTYLSADWLYPSDGRHYRPGLNRMMLSWFYRLPDANLMKDGEQSQTQAQPLQQQKQKYYRQVV